MPTFYPEGNTSLPSDDAMRSLHKIVSNGSSGGSGSVFSGHYGGGTPTQTPTGTSAIAYDLDAPFQVWNWDGSAWF